MGQPLDADAISQSRSERAREVKFFELDRPLAQETFFHVPGTAPTGGPAGGKSLTHGLTVRTLLPVAALADTLPIPVPRGMLPLSAMVIEAESGERLPTATSLRGDSPMGGYGIGLSGHKAEKFGYEVGLGVGRRVPANRLPPELRRLDWKRLEGPLAELKQAGLTHLARLIEDRRAKRDGAMSLDELGALFRGAVFGTAWEAPSELPGTSGPFSKYARFAEDGVLMAPPSVGSLLFADLVNRYLGEGSRFRLDVVSGFLAPAGATELTTRQKSTEVRVLTGDKLLAELNVETKFSVGIGEEWRERREQIASTRAEVRRLRKLVAEQKRGLAELAGKKHVLTYHGRHPSPKDPLTRASVLAHDLLDVLTPSPSTGLLPAPIAKSFGGEAPPPPERPARLVWIRARANQELERLSGLVDSKEPVVEKEMPHLRQRDVVQKTEELLRTIAFGTLGLDPAQLSLYYVVGEDEAAAGGITRLCRAFSEL
jgi:hypothetical protein